MERLALPRIIYHGGGSLSALPKALAQLGVHRPFIVTDPFLAASGLLDALTDMLDADGIGYGLFTQCVADPTTTVIDAAVAALQQTECDCVIGFGGGSPIDTAKAIAVLAGRAIGYNELKVPAQIDEPGLPVVAVPTTAGTGSEATRFTIISNQETGEKMLCAGLAFLPTAAIVDFELTMGMPRRLTADTGIDSLTHAMEAYVSRLANPFSDAMALSAMRLLAANIRTACSEPDNRAAREAMMTGAHQAGIAFSNASVALVHGMSRPIGALFHVPHGLSNAMLLPAVTRFSVPGAVGRYADCARACGYAAAHEGDQGAAARLIEALQALNADLDVPTPAAYGIDAAAWHDNIPLMATQAVQSGSPANNPRAPSVAEIEALYREVWG
ncbi:MAG: iron-containing alcohol dehydrogenase [Sphingobium sp.]